MKYLLFFLLTTLFFNIGSFGETGKSKKIERSSQSKEKGNVSTLVDQNKKLSTRVDSLAKSLDLYLAGSETDPSENTTSILISNKFRHEEGGVKENLPGFNLNLRLPNLEKKWKLKLSSVDESEKSSRVSGNRIDSENEKESLGTSLELNQALGGVKASFIPRLQLSPVIGMSFLVKFEKQIGTQQIRYIPTLSFYAKPEKGTGIFTSQNTVFEISKLQYLTWINEWEYSDFNNTFSANNGFADSYLLAYNKTIKASLIFESSNRPNYHLEKYVFSTSYFHKWYYRIFHYEILPYISYSKEFRFKGKVGIWLNAYLIF